MTQYIDKSAVVAEIRRIMTEEMSFFKDCCNDELENTSSPAVYTRMEMLLSFLDTLEVKEVDSDKCEDGYERGYERGYEQAIKKACEWIHTAIYLDYEYGIDHRYETLEDLLDDFKKAMKGD